MFKLLIISLSQEIGHFLNKDLSSRYIISKNVIICRMYSNKYSIKKMLKAAHVIMKQIEVESKLNSEV